MEKIDTIIITTKKDAKSSTVTLKREDSNFDRKKYLHVYEIELPKGIVWPFDEDKKIRTKSPVNTFDEVEKVIIELFGAEKE